MAVTAVGRIHTPFKNESELPVQGTANDARGTVAVLPVYGAALKDIDGFDRIWLLYVGHDSGADELLVVPKLDQVTRGVFATRARRRPNGICMTCVKLLRVDGCTLQVEGVDMLDGADLLDLKPYVPRFDSHDDAWAGWLEHRVPHERAWQEKKPQLVAKERKARRQAPAT